MPRFPLLPFLLLAVLIGACWLPTATAHFKDAKIEIYQAITIPIIDGTYNMTLNSVQIGGQERFVDEWNDAAWVQIPKRVGPTNVTAYSGYKYDSEFLYIALDAPSATIFGQVSFATAFDPMHDGGTQQAKPDDFVVGSDWWPGSAYPFEMWMRYGSTDGSFGEKTPIPKELVAEFGGKLKKSPTPILSTPHLFVELRIPLSIGGLSQRINSTVGIETELYMRDTQTDYIYPDLSGGYAFIPDNYADAVFSKSVNPNPTIPAIPEFPAGFVPLALFIVLGAVQIIVRRRRGKG